MPRRPRPDRFPVSRPRRMAGFRLVALACLVAMSASPAIAQPATGAERYEVTITPPKRPGTEAPVAAEPAIVPAPAANDDGGPPAGSAAAVSPPSGAPPL